MISVEEAELIFKKRMPSWGETVVHPSDALQLITANALIADRAYPAVERATMDGIAVAWESWANGMRAFPIAGICAAGSPEATLSDPNSCFEIMTGAAVPRAAQLVIPYEDVSIQNDVALVDSQHTYKPFENIHRRGSDFAAGTTLVLAGAAMNGPRWGVAASLGYAALKCRKSPRIKVISTGDELVDVHQVPLDHQIRRSNSYALKASLQQNGFLDVELDHIPDDEVFVANHYQQNKTNYDVLIYSGGVSKGKFDYLPKMWEKAGVQKYIHEVSQRPGKPLWFGVDHDHTTAVLGLPGNPISSLVCLHRYFIENREMYVQLQAEIHFQKELTYFVPVKIECGADAVVKALPLLAKNSGEFAVLAESDGFVELPKERSRFLAQENVRFFPWAKLW